MAGFKIHGIPQSSETIDYAYTDTNWTDKMTEYNGQTITYDKIGNPLTYRDGMTMTWKRGRQLTTLQTAENSIQYKYDSDSIRTSKIVDGVVHTYEYLDGLLMHETRGEQAYDYYYDANGQLYAVSYKLSATDTKKVYYFTHNWRGDIVGIYNGNGELKATYSYDAWGNVTAIEDANGNAITSATHIANLNPFRYRGYYQDTETGLYYLLSRYYDPVTHRFVNMDNQLLLSSDIIGTNVFAYCGSNPVNRVDFGGQFWNNIKNSISNAVNKIKTKIKTTIDKIKQDIYATAKIITKKHFDERTKRNGEHPKYGQVYSDPDWTRVPDNQAKFHDNGVGRAEIKYTHKDGREAVFDGDTLKPMKDPRYMATYNFAPIRQLPDNPKIGDYLLTAKSGIAHLGQDIVPYLFMGNSPSDTTTPLERILMIF